MTRNDTFLAAAAALLGPRGLTCDPDLLAPWLTDWRGRYTGSAMGLASPADSAQLAKLVMLAGEHNVTLVPQGGNSGMSGGATPDASGASLLVSLLTLSMSRMQLLKTFQLPWRLSSSQRLFSSSFKFEVLSSQSRPLS